LTAAPPSRSTRRWWPFDTRKVPREVAPAVLFVSAEHVSGQIERQADARLHARDAGLFAGRSILIIDEALQRSMPGHPIAPLWRRFRDSRSRCPAGKGMGDGAAVGSCRAKDCEPSADHAAMDIHPHTRRGAGD
jgi:hypothetical protein